MIQPTYLVDTSIFIFRAWFSLNDEFQDPDGQPTNAIYGFLGFLSRFMTEAAPQRALLAFDESLDSSFRNSIYPAYKANRPAAPPELKRQFAYCRQLADALGFYTCGHAQFEADDLIASAARHEHEQLRSVSVVSADKDLAQVLQPGDTFWDFGRKRLSYSETTNHFGVRPDQIADFLALTGDSVDNIPGVKGVGPKSATALLQHFGSLQALLDRSAEIEFLRLRGAKSMATQIRASREQIGLSRRLTGLKDDIELDTERLAVRPDDRQTLDQLLRQLGFGRLMQQRLTQARKKIDFVRGEAD
ncbi:MAG: exodeoxyribonuclease IX [Lysobacteraceae bacterium]|nr:MAG: exodeoxyribonuclease IX [Xanthomonadaceae bacterium]